MTKIKPVTASIFPYGKPLAPPPDEIKFKMKDAVVIVRTRKLKNSPHYLYSAQVTNRDGTNEIIRETISWPSHEDIILAYTSFKQRKGKS